MKSTAFSHFATCALALALGTGLSGCDPDEPVCDDGFYYDVTTGTCELDLGNPGDPSCEDGFYYDDTTAACEPNGGDPSCDDGFYYDETTFSCVPNGGDPGDPDALAIDLTAEAVATLPEDLQASYAAGTVSAYYTLFQLDMYSAYPDSARNNIYYVSEMVDDTYDPVEFFLALGTDYWCCDIGKWGGTNQSTCYTNREQTQNYCTANSSEDCYQWGASDDLKNAGAQLTGYCVNETLGPCFPCETIRDNFDDIANAGTSALETETGLAPAVFNAGMNAFIDTLKEPVFGAVSLINEAGLIEYIVVTQFYIPVDGQWYFVDLPQNAQPKIWGSGSMTLPVGAAGYQILNEFLLPQYGLEDGVSGIVTKAIVGTACAQAPFGTQTVCEDRFTNFAQERVDEMFTNMVSNITLEVAEVTMSPIAAGGGTVTMTANGQTVSGTYFFPTR